MLCYVSTVIFVPADTIYYTMLAGIGSNFEIWNKMQSDGTMQFKLEHQVPRVCTLLSNA